MAATLKMAVETGTGKGAAIGLVTGALVAVETGVGPVCLQASYHLGRFWSGEGGEMGPGGAELAATARGCTSRGLPRFLVHKQRDG